MKRYDFTGGERALLEELQVPFAVYRFSGTRFMPEVLSDGFLKLFGYENRAEAAEDIDRDMFANAHPDDKGRAANAALDFAEGGERMEVIYRSKKPDGKGYRMIHVSGQRIPAEDGELAAHVWYTDEGDYTEAAEAQRSGLTQKLSAALHERSLVKANLFDDLTGLPSMTYFFELAENCREHFLSENDHPVLLYMDFGGMKFFNQRHGFSKGDVLLKEFADILSTFFGKDRCSRLGSDHFGVTTIEAGLEDILKELFKACEKMNGGNSLPLRVGIYRDQMDPVSVSTACDRAKSACDALRNTYGSAFNYFDKELLEKEERRQYILTHFDTALKEKWIQVYYQPIVRAVNGRVSDDEALARWLDPYWGMLSPADFIPILEDAGQIYKLDLYVVEEVLEKLRIQEETGISTVPQSVNLSRSDFDSCDVVEEIRRRVDAAGVSHDKITIEITESIIGSDFAFMKEQIERFRALGFPVWMDDFGSGYSSLDVLQEIQFDLIKFDMSFMRKLDDGENGKIILTQLMKMTTALGVDAVCEGVETEDQVHFLQDIGCAKLQGYYFCKPTPLDLLLERYATGTQIGYEDPQEVDYADVIGRVNLYDISAITNDQENALHNVFNSLPICVMEVKGNATRVVRSNQSYRDFAKRFFGTDIPWFGEFVEFQHGPSMHFAELIKQCCETGNRMIIDDKLPDGTTSHTFIRRIAENPVTGVSAAAVAVLSVTGDPEPLDLNLSAKDPK